MESEPSHKGHRPLLFASSTSLTFKQESFVMMRMKHIRNLVPQFLLYICLYFVSPLIICDKLNPSQTFFVTSSQHDFLLYKKNSLSTVLIYHVLYLSLSTCNMLNTQRYFWCRYLLLLHFLEIHNNLTSIDQLHMSPYQSKRLKKIGKTKKLKPKNTFSCHIVHKTLQVESYVNVTSRLSPSVSDTSLTRAIKS